jgi:hypothetical protein
MGRTQGARLCVAALVTALCAGSVACTGPRPDGSPPGTAGPANAGRRADIATLIERLEAVHPNPYHGISESAFRAAADDLAARAGGLRDDEFLVGIMRLVGLLSSRGLDGHSGVWPWDNDLHRFPLRLWNFPEGLYVTGGAPAYRGLVGARITHVDGMPIGQVLARLDPLLPRDNATTVLTHRPVFFVCAAVLSGLGVARRPDRVTLTVAAPGRPARAVEVAAVDARTFEAQLDGWEWILPDRGSEPGTTALARLALAHRDQPYHATYLPAYRAVYLQYNAVQPAGATLVSALADTAEGRAVDRVVVDVRHNHGGDNTTYASFVDHLAGPRVDRPGRLWVLAGRLTFSAAGNFAAEVADSAEHEVFIGEPTGGAPNQYGDHAAIRLPHTGITVTSATEWVEVSDDDRDATGPDIALPYRAADYFGGRDPVLLRALTGRPPR